MPNYSMYTTHFYCTKHKWISRQDAIDPAGRPLCPYCNGRLRSKRKQSAYKRKPKMAKYIAVWTETEDNGGIIECTAIVDCEDTRVAILKALLDYGVSREDIKFADIYQVAQQISGKDIV